MNLFEKKRERKINFNLINIYASFLKINYYFFYYPVKHFLVYHLYLINSILFRSDISMMCIYSYIAKSRKADYRKVPSQK